MFAGRRALRRWGFDVVDIVEADDPKQIEKAAMIIRAYGEEWMRFCYRCGEELRRKAGGP